MDVLEFRETHFCSLKQSINALNYRFHQKQYQEQTRNNSDLIARHYNSLPVHANNISFPPLAPHIPPQCVYGTNGCYATYAPVTSHYAYPVPLSYQQAAIKPPHYATNGYCCNNAYPGYVCQVPTGQLIELEPQSAGYDTVDATRQQRQPRASLQNNDLYSHKKNNVIINNIESSDKAEPFETWEYVYKNLESQGYSKDLGERGDILSALETEKNRQKKIKSTNLDEAINNLIVSDRPLKINEALEKYKENDRDRRKQEEIKKNSNTTPTSSYENLSKTKHASKQKVTKEKTVKTSKKSKASAEIAVSNVNTEVNKWQCGHCTFLNEECRDICEMCSKSKVSVEQQMEIGGSQCPKCTLVNPRESTNCQACGESLRESATYI